MGAGAAVARGNPPARSELFQRRRVNFHDPFNRSRLPDDFSREGRVRLLAEAAAALSRGELAEPAARLFLAGALTEWLRTGGRCGSLERDFLRVTQRERSTMTPQRVLAKLSARRGTDADDSDTVQVDESATEFDGNDDES